MISKSDPVDVEPLECGEALIDVAPECIEYLQLLRGRGAWSPCRVDLIRDAGAHARRGSREAPVLRGYQLLRQRQAPRDPRRKIVVLIDGLALPEGGTGCRSDRSEE